MRVARAMPVAIGAAVISLAACSRQQGGAAPASPAAGTVSSSAAAPLSPTPAGAPPAESGLSIKRGIAMLAQDRATFRPCGEDAELWLLDQSEAGVTETLGRVSGAQARSGPDMLYIEAHGERAPVAEKIPAARAYAGTFVLEQVLYAGVQGDVRGCEEPAPGYVVAARGNEPFWAVEVREERMQWRQPQAPQEIDLGTPQTQNAEGAVRYHAAAAGHELELLIDAQACRDSMSGEFFAYTARAVLDGREFNGCARVAK